MAIHRWRAEHRLSVALACAAVAFCGCGSIGDGNKGTGAGTDETSGVASGVGGTGSAGAAAGAQSGSSSAAVSGVSRGAMAGTVAGSAGVATGGAETAGMGSTGARSAGAGTTDGDSGIGTGTRSDASVGGEAGDALAGEDASVSDDADASVGAAAEHDASVHRDASVNGEGGASHDAGASGDATLSSDAGPNHDSGMGIDAGGDGTSGTSTGTSGTSTGTGGTTSGTSSGSSSGASGTATNGANGCNGSGTTWYASPSGSGNNCTLASPCALGTAAGKPAPGDIVCLRGGTYTQGPFVTVSGTASKWISFVAYPGELPIIDSTTGINVTGSFVSFNGLVAEGASAGFANKWVGQGATTSNGNLEFVNCIADFNTKSGIAFQSAQGVHIAQCIVAHNGASTTESWSSGVDLFGAQGTPADNIIERNVAFENVDNQNHTDGSGFIADDVGTGATFQNNIGFRNGGSCIRITTAVNTHILNNSCFHDGLDTAAVSPNAPGEVLFSSAGTLSGVVLQNNLAAASGWNGTQTAFVDTGSLAISPTNVGVNANGAAPFFADPAGVNPNFNLVSASGGNIVGTGSTANSAPTDDIGFDPKCITNATAPQGPSSAPTVLGFWTYSIDYAYIASVGGVAGCFHPETRANPPSIGAYEP